jgi:hypothetical protein
MDGHHWVFLALLAQPHNFLTADVVTVKVHARTSPEEQFVAAERFVVMRL